MPSIRLKAQVVLVLLVCVAARGVAHADTPNYVAVIELPAAQGASSASDINNNGEVIGNDGNGAFTWTASGVLNYLPGQPAATVPSALNDSGLIAGWLYVDGNGPLSFRYDPQSDAQPVYQPGAGQAFAINSSGTVAGGGYYPIAAWGGYSGVQMFRVDTGDVQILPSDPVGEQQAGAWGIDTDGTVVGTQFVQLENGITEAVRYSDSRGTEVLNDLLPPAEAAVWNLTQGQYIRSGEILGYGTHNGLPRSFRMRFTASGDFASIDDLGMLPQYAVDSSNMVNATRENGVGEIVGVVYDGPWAEVPLAAFVYTDATGMVDLNSLIDPDSGWHLIMATSINDNHDVVGYGINNDGVQRAFKLTLPDLSPCQPPADSCHVQGQRNLLTGVCSNPPIADGTVCIDGNICTQGETCQAGTCQANSNFPVVVGLPVDDLGNVGGGFAEAEAVNAGNRVVGVSSTAAGNSHAFLWEGAPPMSDLGGLSGWPAQTNATAISSGGAIAGSAPQPDGSSHVFIDVRGPVDLGPGGDNSAVVDTFTYQGGYAYGIDDAWDIAGVMTVGGPSTGSCINPVRVSRTSGHSADPGPGQTGSARRGQSSARLR